MSELISPTRPHAMQWLVGRWHEAGMLSLSLSLSLSSHYAKWRRTCVSRYITPSILRGTCVARYTHWRSVARGCMHIETCTSGQLLKPSRPAASIVWSVNSPYLAGLCRSCLQARCGTFTMNLP